MRSVIKCHGSKAMLAKRFVELMPRHRQFVDAYCGSMAVLLAKDGEGVSEIANDRNGQLVNFWRVLQNERTFLRFCQVAQATPVSEDTFDEALAAIEKDDDPVMRALHFFVLARQSVGARRTHHSRPTVARLRGGMADSVSSWLGAVERLLEIHERIKRVHVLNGDALEVIRRYDHPDTLCYIDPPYPSDTRKSVGQYGEFEMTDQQHLELLRTLRSFGGTVMLSSYPNPMYDEGLAGWDVVDFEVKAHSASAAVKTDRVERLYLNYKV